MADANEALEELLRDDEAVLEAGNKLVKSLQEAAVKGDLTKMKEALDKQPELLNARDRELMATALHSAVRAGNEASVKLLLERGASFVLGDKEGHTAVDYARLFKKPKLLAKFKELIRAKPPDIKQVGPVLSTFFEYPVDLDLMEWALRHYGKPLLDAKGRDLLTPLHLIITNRDPALVQKLLDLGADPFVRDVNNQSPLDFARLLGNKEMMLAISKVMKVQLYAFVGLLALFFVFRNYSEPTLAWYVVGVFYPTIWTALAALSAQAHDQHAEWATYWSVAGLLLSLEKGASYIPPHVLHAVFGAPDADGKPPELLTNALSYYNIIKIVGTLFLVYPSSRGAKQLHERLAGAPSWAARVGTTAGARADKSKDE